MIYEALTCLTNEMNDYLKLKLSAVEDKVVLSGLVNPDGSMAAQGENKVLLTLVNLEKETVARKATLPNKAVDMNINLYVLFSAYFGATNYAEALRFLSFVVGYLQQKNVFTRTNTPRLDKNIQKLIVEMESLTSERLNNLWGSLGAKYIPSVLYKVRMLTYDESVLREFRPDITGVGVASA